MANWEEIKHEWETTEITLADLAEKHGVKLGTLKSRKSRDTKDGNPWSRDGTKKDATKTQKVASFSNEVATKKDDISWVEIESEYVTDIRKKPCTLKDLAQKYGVAFQTIKEYAAKNDWTVKRNKHHTNTIQKTVQKTAERISDDVANVTARHFNISNKLLDVLEKTVNTPDEFNKVTEILRTGYAPGEFDEKITVEVVDALNEKKLASVINSLNTIQKMQRQTLNILDAKDQHKVDMDKRKMGDGDEEEHEDDGFFEALGATATEVWSEEDD